MIYIYTLTTINLFPFSGELQALLNKQKILELLENRSRSIRKKAIKSRNLRVQGEEGCLFHIMLPENMKHGLGEGFDSTVALGEGL